MATKLLGIGAQVVVRGFHCAVVRITRGGCIVRVVSGRMKGSTFTATLREIADYAQNR